MRLLVCFSLVLVLGGCSSASCPAIYHAPILVAVIDDSSSTGQMTVFVCDAVVTATDDAGKTGMTSKTSDGTEGPLHCAYGIFAQPGKYTVSAAWNGRSAQATAVVPDFVCGGVAMSTKVQLHL